MKLITAGNDFVTFRLRVGGVDASTNYQFQSFTANDTTLTGSRNSAQTSFQIGAGGTTSLFGIELGSPAIAEQTSLSSLNSYNTANNQIMIRNGFHSTATAYDGFSILCVSNITGSVSVYGYNK